MMNNTVPNKVVSLSDYDRGKRPEGSGLLVECRDMAADLLAKSLSRMLDRVDESLFELAESALSTEVRLLYLDARSKALAHRASIEADFRRNFVAGFNKKLTGAGADAFSKLAASIELSLVDEEDFEASLAVADIVKKMKTKTGDELTALDCRIAQLLQSPDLPEDDNPLGPQSIIEAFKDACNRLESNVNVKLIILKQFDALVSDDIQQVYHNLNHHLINRNVLPTIPPELLRRRGKSVSQARPAAQDAAAMVDAAVGEKSDSRPASPVAAEQELFATLQQLFAARQSSSFPAVGTSMPSAYGAAPLTGGAGHAPAGAFPELQGGFPTLNTNVMDMLNHLQHGNIAAAIGEASGLDLSELDSGKVNVLHHLKQTSIGQVADPVDSMTIDIVAMLFDYIFDDRHIPDSLKALIGRLQIPVLKVAILDKKFFSKKSHPARRLLDTVAHAALGWSEQGLEQDKLYAKLDALVHRILSSFEEDLGVFDAALLELEAFLREEEAQAQDRAEQSAKVIYDREWLEIAKAVAEEEIKRRLASAEMPQVIRDFLSTQWSNYLLATYVKQGSDSEIWRAGLQTMDDLIWSVLPKRAAEERMKLVNMLPGMLKRLEAALDANSTAKDVRERFFSELVHCHASAIKSGIAPAKPSEAIVPTAPVAVTFDILPSAPSEIERQLLDELVPVEKLATEQPAVTASSFESDLIASANLRNPEKVAEIQNVLADRLLDSVGGDQFDLQAKGLQRGTWVEFRLDDGAVLKAKLAWVSPMKNMYLFTNRQGLNAMSIKLAGLAAKFRAGSARIVEDDALVDRAVNSMLVSLKASDTVH